MSAKYQTLKPPEAPVDAELSDEDSIQGSPLLDTGSFFSKNSLANTPDQSRLSYHQNEGYDDEPYETAYQPQYDSPYHTIDEGDPYSATTLSSSAQEYINGRGSPTKTQEDYADQGAVSPTKTVLSPIIEPPSELLPAQRPEIHEGDGSFHSTELTSQTGLSSPFEAKDSPHTSLEFGRSRQRPKSTLISTGFRAPSGVDISREPTKRGIPARNLSREPSSRNDEDEDALPFEATTRMAMQGRPQSMIQLSSADRKIMTKQSFEDYRRSINEADLLNRENSIIKGPSSPTRYNSFRGSSPTRGTSEKEHEEADELDEKHQKLQSAKLRQEQDARMSVYRQSMMKIIGNSSPSDGVSISSSRAVPENRSITMDRTTISEPDIMDDIPLSILQAHRFPRKSPQRRSPGSPNSALMSDYSEMPQVAESIRSAPLVYGNGGTSPRPLSIASSRMLPNVFNADSNRHSRGLDGYNGSVSPSPSLPSIFGNKDKMLSRGLIGEIQREEGARKRRQTMGYGYGAQINAPLNEPNELNDKLDMVIELLSKMSPQEPSMPKHQIPNIGMRPVSHRSPSISSFQSQDQPNSPNFGFKGYGQQFMNHPNMGPNSPYSPGMSPMGIPYSPGMPPMGVPGVPIPIPPPHRPAAGPSNRPSRMRLVKTANDEEDDEDEAMLLKLKQEREELKKKWMQKNNDTGASVDTDDTQPSENSEAKEHSADTSIEEPEKAEHDSQQPV